MPSNNVHGISRQTAVQRASRSTAAGNLLSESMDYISRSHSLANTAAKRSLIPNRKMRSLHVHAGGSHH